MQYLGSAPNVYKYKDVTYSDDFLLKVIESMKERVSFIKDFFEKSYYFFEAPINYDGSVIKKRWKNDTPEQLIKLKDAFIKLENPSKEDFENSLRQTAEQLGIGIGKLIHPLRLAVSGVGSGPGVFDIVNALGKNETVERINKALGVINAPDNESDN